MAGKTPQILQLDPPVELEFRGQLYFMEEGGGREREPERVSSLHYQSSKCLLIQLHNTMLKLTY
jgi:hypothetical protein